MAYLDIVEDVALHEDDQLCTHQACNKLHLSSLQLLDKREVPKPEDYKADPNTESIEPTCPACGKYLLDFLLQAMEKTNWIPAAQRYYCTGCKSTRKIPPSASSIFHSKCGKCKKPVAISMAKTVTYLSLRL